jgi:hypothetical protein
MRFHETAPRNFVATPCDDLFSGRLCGSAGFRRWAGSDKDGHFAALVDPFEILPCSRLTSGRGHINDCATSIITTFEPLAGACVNGGNAEFSRCGAQHSNAPQVGHEEGKWIARRASAGLQKRTRAMVSPEFSAIGRDAGRLWTVGGCFAKASPLRIGFSHFDGEPLDVSRDSAFESSGLLGTGA